jgi:hypothetical protein
MTNNAVINISRQINELQNEMFVLWSKGEKDKAGKLQQELEVLAASLRRVEEILS